MDKNNANNNPSDDIVQITKKEVEKEAEEAGEASEAKRSADTSQNHDDQQIMDAAKTSPPPQKTNIAAKPKSPPIISVDAARPQRIPYSAIFNNPIRADYYLPDTPIEARIVNYEENRTVLTMSQYLYHIQLRHGPFCWTIKRGYANFRHLHNQIWLFYTTLTLPLPTQNSRENRKVLAKIGDIEFPKFPMIPDTIFVSKSVDKRIRLLEEYLRFILSLSLFRSHPSVLNFLQISPFSFIDDLGKKGEEFLVKKRAGGFRKAAFCTRVENFFTDITGHWRNRCIVVKDSCMFYYRPKDKKIRYVMLFDEEFSADFGMQTTGVQHGVRIQNKTRQLVVKTKNGKNLAEYLQSYARSSAPDFVGSFRHHQSFAPTRSKVACQWFVDGSAHFDAVSQAIQSAEHEIYITDWWLSPEIYLKRPSLGRQWRLDAMLQAKAEAGVRIFVLLYKEVELGISINSVYTKRTLMGMHKNIVVLRSPDAARGGPLLWSHHEKLVVIDQRYAFVGGIDLCFGRWDNYEHRLTDLGGISYQQNDETVMIHNSTKPTGLRYRSISQTLLSAEVSSILGTASPLPNGRSGGGDGDGDSNVTGGGGGGGRGSRTRLSVQFSLFPPDDSPPNERSFDTQSNITETICVPKDSKPQFCLPFAIENDQQQQPKQQQQNFDRGSSEDDEKPGTSRTADNNNNNNNDEDDDDEEDDEDDEEDDENVENDPSSTKGKKNRRKYIGSGKSTNLRTRISNKIRKKRIQAVSKFLQMNRRIRSKITDFSGDDDISYISSDGGGEKTDDFIQQSVPRIATNQVIIGMDQLEGGAKLWIGKDYTNFIVKDFNELHQPFQDAIDRRTTPRMPWHDISCVVIGAAARDVARHFIQRWNFVKYSKAKLNDRYPWLIPKTYDDVDGAAVDVPKFLLRTHRVKCQVLRSVCAWSIGTTHEETSIVQAYIETIHNAQHYIYIENQFFISQCKTNPKSDEVKNQIAQALYLRILRAHKRGETFRVYVIIPLLPAFEGEIGTSTGSAIQQITHYNYSTICKGENSLLGRLRREMDDPQRYIGFYGLRAYDQLNGRLITELIYVHSKILIADDCVTIIGSANINDRSMLGTRDSEVAVIIEDEEFDCSPSSNVMNGRPYRCGRFAGSLRRMLMREHLGIYKKPAQQSAATPTVATFSVDDYSSSSPPLSSPQPPPPPPNLSFDSTTPPAPAPAAASETSPDSPRLRFDSVSDPICDHFWNDIWNETARRNTAIFEQVFTVIPTDEIRRFAQIPEYINKTKLYKIDPELALERLQSVQGHLVLLPLQFLIDEATPDFVYNPQDHFIPNVVWT